MSQKLIKPLVLDSDGSIRQIKTDETMDAIAKEVDMLLVVNGESTPLTAGKIVYISTNNTVKLANADGITTKNAFGIVAEPTIESGVSGMIQTNGQISNTTTAWDAITGTTGGLTAGTSYYLSNSTPGLITSIPPTSGWIVKIGTAVSSTVLDLHISQPIGLS